MMDYLGRVIINNSGGDIVVSVFKILVDKDDDNEYHDGHPYFCLLSEKILDNLEREGISDDEIHNHLNVIPPVGIVPFSFVSTLIETFTKNVVVNTLSDDDLKQSKKRLVSERI